MNKGFSSYFFPDTGALKTYLSFGSGTLICTCIVCIVTLIISHKRQKLDILLIKSFVMFLLLFLDGKNNIMN